MYWLTYAYVYGGVIKELAVYEPLGAYTYANDMAHKIYGPNAIAIEVTDYPVHVGDEYRNNRFYRNGVEIQKVNTIRDDIETVYEAIAELGELIGG